MTTRNIPHELLCLATLAGVGLSEIQHFIAGAGVLTDGAALIEFDVPRSHCAVVVAVEQFNSDDSMPNTTAQTQGGAAISEVQTATWTTGNDLFLVRPSGRASIALAATPQAGKTYAARAVGYLLPARAYDRLSSMSTKILS
jgi:hypothetical protein